MYKVLKNRCSIGHRHIALVSLFAMVCIAVGLWASAGILISDGLSLSPMAETNAKESPKGAKPKGIIGAKANIGPKKEATSATVTGQSPAPAESPAKGQSSPVAKTAPDSASSPASISASSKLTGTASTSASAADGIRTLRSSINRSLIDAFDQLKFTIVINDDAAYLGRFSPAGHKVEMRYANIGTFRHEMGHFLDVLKGKPSQSQEFASIFAGEKDAYTGPNGYYTTQNPQEYFAQSYRNYLEDGARLKAERPLTHRYISSQVASISAADIADTYNRYRCYW